MSAMASQITSLTIVYATVYSGRSKKASKLRVTGLCAGNSSPVIGEFPAQRVSNAEMFPFDDVIIEQIYFIEGEADRVTCNWTRITSTNE